MLDEHKEVNHKVIDSMDLNYASLVQMQMNLIAMLANKDEEYFKLIMRQLITKVSINKKDFNLEKIAQIISYLSSSIIPEKIFMEFATIFLEMNDLVFVQDMI